LHPDVVNTRRLIKDLEDQKRKELAELRKAAAAAPGAVPNTAAGSVIAQEFSRMLATSEVQVAALKARVAEYQARYNQAKGGLKIAPQIEAEAAQLNRDYGIIKRNYESLVARRQSATMSGELEMASGVVDFRLIDPPRVSPKPVSPNLVVLLSAVLGLAVALGLVLAFAASQLRPVYLDAQQLREKTGLPLLGVVGMVVNDSERRRERMSNLRFYAGTGGLFASFLLVLVTVSILSARQVG
jgi:polysaccharide chain length determinant protein (PEP-CTERM system associated)